MKKNLRINILILLIALIIVLCIAEVTMRFAWEMGGWVKRPIYQRSHNPYLRYELVSNVQSANISINSDGFRGPEYPVTKPANTFRILMLGDSETFSYMLTLRDTLPVQMENLLNEKSARLRYEVLNFGIEGYGTLQELEMLKAKGLKYNPDLLILNYVLNDPDPGEYYFNKTFLIRHSALVRYFTYRIKKGLIRKERRRLKIGTDMDNYFYYHQPKYFTHIKNAILEISELARQKKKRLVVVIFPDSSIVTKDFKQNYPYWQLHKLIKGINSDNILFIDLIDEFNRLNMTPQTVSINYIYNESHKNPAALKVAAEYIYRVLVSKKIVPD